MHQQKIYDAVVVGSGPNGLTAAIALAQAGASVVVLEARDRVGGGTRTEELTLPGFRHDVCSAAHPMGALSPYLRTLPLSEHGLSWVRPPVSVAHPLIDEPAVLLETSMERTAEGLGPDGEAWTRLLSPFVRQGEDLLADALAPLGWPRRPFLMARFGLKAFRSALSLARSHFQGPRARALFAGCAAHALVPLDFSFTAALGLMFAITGHMEPWPVAKGGSESITIALVSYLRSLGGETRTGHLVRTLGDLPPHRVAIFDTDPRQLAAIASEALPERFRSRLGRYRYGPGVFKMDWALDGPIPWTDPRVLKASTVHLGGPMETVARSERAMWTGQVSPEPFVLLVQQSEHDPTRAPPGQHTGYAYCHVPGGSDTDHSDLIEALIERYAPGFRQRILARHTMTARAFEDYNPNWVGGAITGGVADLSQLFTRPTVRVDPYGTPNPALFLCSASTPPGGGVHGMCGFHAARSALRALQRNRPERILAPQNPLRNVSQSTDDSRHGA